MEMKARNPSVSVLIVDDEALMRAGLRLMTDGVDGVTVVGEARNGAEAIEQVQRLDPDIVLMDIRMPGLDGIEATRSLQRADARARVIVLTAFDTDVFLLEALRAGATSFLLKDSDPGTVLRAIHDAAEDRPSFSPAVLERLVTIAARSTSDRPVSEPTPARPAAPQSSGVEEPLRQAPPRNVTSREWEVGRLVARGLTNAEVAGSLFLSTTTVKTHLASLFAKLHVSNRVQLAVRVLELEADSGSGSGSGSGS